MLRSKQEQWNAYNRLPDLYGKADNFEALIESGFRHAMVLHRNLDTADFMSSAANKETIEAQAAILRHVLSLDSDRLPKKIFDRLWSAFQEGRGALVFDGDLLGMQLADKEVIKPQARVWFAAGKEFSRAPWVDHWRAQGVVSMYQKLMRILCPGWKSRVKTCRWKTSSSLFPV